MTVPEAAHTSDDYGSDSDDDSDSDDGSDSDSDESSEESSESSSEDEVAVMNHEPRGDKVAPLTTPGRLAARVRAKGRLLKQQLSERRHRLSDRLPHAPAQAVPFIMSPVKAVLGREQPEGNKRDDEKQKKRKRKAN